MLFNSLSYDIIMIIHSFMEIYLRDVYISLYNYDYIPNIHIEYDIPISISQSVCISFMIWYVDRRVVKLYLCLHSYHFIVRTRYAMILYFPEEFRYCQL